jgi:hypothetical protein
MKANELIKELRCAVKAYGNREVVAHDGAFKAVEKGIRQFQQITFGADAASDNKKMPFEIWCHKAK